MKPLFFYSLLASLLVLFSTRLMAYTITLNDLPSSVTQSSSGGQCSVSLGNPKKNLFCERNCYYIQSTANPTGMSCYIKYELGSGNGTASIVLQKYDNNYYICCFKSAQTTCSKSQSKGYVTASNPSLKFNMYYSKCI